MLFTTSWDDGHTLDHRLCELLGRYAVTGTLYICPRHPQVPVPLTTEEIRALGKTMEIGAHTMTHPDLTAVSAAEAQQEIAQSKAWVEQQTGKPCRMFCYPKGRFNPAVRDMVEKAGFAGARTTQVYQFTMDDPFTMPVSLQIYPFPFRPIANRRFIAPLQSARAQTKGMHIGIHEYRGWLPFAKAVFRHAAETDQPFFHLFGHSWEIDKFGMWGQLEDFLKHVSQHKGIRPVPNSALLTP